MQSPLEKKNLIAFISKFKNSPEVWLREECAGKIRPSNWRNGII